MSEEYKNQNTENAETKINAQEQLPNKDQSLASANASAEIKSTAQLQGTLKTEQRPTASQTSPAVHATRTVERAPTVNTVHLDSDTQKSRNIQPSSVQSPALRTEQPKAASEQKNAPTDSHQNVGYTQGSFYSAPEPPKKAKKQTTRPSTAFTALLCAICVVLGAASGLGGAFAFRYLFDDTENVADISNKKDDNDSANDSNDSNASADDGDNNNNESDDSNNGDVVIDQTINEPSAEPEEGSLTSVIETISQTVVEIRTEKVSYGYFVGNYVSEGAGSGVIISEDKEGYGYIITNNHVVEGADTLTVRTKAGDEYDATLVGTDAQTDIAIIKIKATGLLHAEIGTSNDLLVGQRAIAIGNPLGELGGTVTIGYISALDREVNIDGVDMTLLQTDAAINPGNSGGGLFDIDGRLIGVVNAKSTGSDIEGLGFAIPIDTAITIAKDLIETGHVSGRPGLGISVSEVTTDNYSQFYNSELYKYIDSYGVYVVADERGNFEYGDRIVAFDDTTVSNQSDLTSAINKCAIGDKVTVTVSRGRKLVEVEIELVELNA